MIVKSGVEFHFDYSQGRSKTTCKECSNAARRANNRANPGRDTALRKENSRRNPDREKAKCRRSGLAQYGLTVEDYARMYDEHRGVCAICYRECPSGKRLAVDHCHATGRVRGLTCTSCNNGLGRFRDSPTLLRRAASYLELHESSH